MSKDLTYGTIHDDVLAALRPPPLKYYLVMLMLAGGIGTMFMAWAYQVRTGMGVAGINHPVAWGVYIANFVFWVGIAHSGTLISAILHLVRSKWRASVARSAEAMTVFAVMTAGLFPLIHLGRLWVFYYILPYPSQRQLWPNFTSPLVWDVVAVSTYLTVSTIFWYVGLIPDLAASRDRWRKQAGGDHPRTRFYHRLALGWTGSGNQWRHYGRGYLFFAALATPLVISVHSVVSWDFAVSLLPGWHTTIFAPYFVAGAIHSGLAMVLTLVIPMRAILKLHSAITIDNFESVAKTLLVTTAIMGYAYLVEPFIAWYSGDLHEQQFAWWRATGWLAWGYWALFLLNVIVPLALLFRKCRRSLAALICISILINVGMWLERYVIVVGSTAHDFMPHNWGRYAPTWVEITISLGSFCFFSFWFFIFAKLFPTVAMNDVKEVLAERTGHIHGENAVDDPPDSGQRAIGNRASATGLMAVFRTPPEMIAGLKRLLASRFKNIETYTPFRIHEAEHLMGRTNSPVRFWTLTGALLGLSGGFALAMGSAEVNDLIVGGKFTPRTIIPYAVIGFEATVLLGAIFNLVGLIVHCRIGLRRMHIWQGHDERFGRDRFGIFIEAGAVEAGEVRRLLESTKPEEVYDVR